MSDSNVTQFPVVPRPRAKAQLIQIRDAASVSESHKLQDIGVVTRDLNHAVLKFITVHEYHGEIPRAIRLIEGILADLKNRSTT